MPLNLGRFVDLTGSNSFEVLDNERIAALTGLKVERVLKSTGMKTRHILKKDKDAADIGVEVAEKWLDRAGIPARRLGGLAVMHTSHGADDQVGVAEAIAKRFGIAREQVLALSYGCAGFPKILAEASPIAERLPDGKHCLVVNVETPDRQMDARDSRATPIFAAGAAATSLSHEPGHRLLFAETEDVIPPEAPPDRPIFRTESVEAENFWGERSQKTVFRMDGDLAYINGAKLIEQASWDSLQRVMDARWTGRRILVVPHQPNARMIKGLADMVAPLMRKRYESKVSDVRFINGMEGMGNTISVTIPSTLARSGTIEGAPTPENGDIILLPAAGICMTDPGGKMSVGRGALIWNEKAV